MSVLLMFKTVAIKKLTGCPLCGSFRMHFWKSPDHFPTEESIETGYTPNGGDKVAAQFHCGLELCISDANEIICRRTCTEIGKETASEINSQVEGDFEDQEEEQAA